MSALIKDKGTHK